MNAMKPDEALQQVEALPWHAVVPGIDFRLLFTSAESGRWTVMFRCQPGSFFPRHRHYGAGEYFVLRGRMEYRMGSAAAGTWGYEPLGAVHEHTAFPEYTELLFTNHGPVAFIDDADAITAVLDHAYLERLAAG